MTKKKAKSTLPAELNENWGSNYMLDGFWHDMEYGHGLRENPPANPIPQPSTRGMAQLPDGLILALEDELDIACQDDEGAMDLEGLGIVAALDPNVDRSDVGIVDHSWLADAFQDPTRLPDTPKDNGIPELQGAWGNRTDGIQRIELYERGEAQYEDGSQEHEDDDVLHRDKLARLIQSAMRKSAGGEPLDRIKAHLASQMNRRETKALMAPVKALEAEHGLVGNVYVRASAYPGLHRGRWSDAFKKAAKGCRYLVAAPGDDCVACAASTGLVLVQTPNEIDWNDAYSHYAPQLAMAGRLDRLATVMDKRLTLRDAFLREGRAPRLHIETAKPRVTMPVDLVTRAQARATLAGHDGVRKVITGDAKQRRLENEKAAKKIGALVRARLITLEEAKVLCATSAPPEMRLRMAHLLAIRTEKGSYSGAIQGDARVRLTAEEFAEAGRQSSRHETMHREASMSQDAERHRLLQGFARLASRHEAAMLKVEQVRSSGKTGGALRRLVARLFDEAERRLVAADLDPILVNAGAFETPDDGSPRTYEGVPLREAKVARPEPVVPPQEIARVARWSRQQMSEGSAGGELDQLLRLRVEPRVLVAAQGLLKKVRAAHEGLSGHLYVDAGAYASPEGTVGCDDGALRHRANSIKLVLAMKRCDGCVFKNADGFCQKYNKRIIDEIDHSNGRVAAFRHRVISSHEASDQETTASFFSGNDIRGALDSDPVDDFGLHNASLDDVESAAPEHHMLNGIFFGGFEV